MEYLRAFTVGGALCVLAQILIDKTKLSPARILVAYVVAGVILGGIGLYGPFADFAGGGATTPLTGFGYLIADGTKKAVDAEGSVGIIKGGDHRRRGRRHRGSPVRHAGVSRFPEQNEIKTAGRTLKKHVRLHVSSRSCFLFFSSPSREYQDRKNGDGTSKEYSGAVDHHVGELPAPSADERLVYLIDSGIDNPQREGQKERAQKTEPPYGARGKKKNAEHREFRKVSNLSHGMIDL